MRNLFEKFKTPKGRHEISDGFTVDTDINQNITEQPVVSKKTATLEAIEWLEILVVAIIAVVVIFTFVFRVATIDGDSMKNTLLNNEKIIISNLNYTAKQGDIVVISRNIENSAQDQTPSNTPIIKRVIAVGGQTVDIDFDLGKVYVDGKQLEEPYISSPTVSSADVKFPLYVPEGYIFVLGDNRMESLDSRFSRIGEGGLIDERYVLGHAIYRLLPFERAGRLDNK